MTPSLRSAFGLAMLAAAIPALAAGTRPTPVSSWGSSAHDVVVGRIVSSSAAWDERKTMIWTEYVVDVDDVWKGAGPVGRRRVKVAGGKVPGRAIEVTHVPRFEVGGTYVLFLGDPSRKFASPTIAGESGLLREVTERDGARILVGSDGRRLERFGDGSVGFGRRMIPVSGTAGEVVTPAVRSDERIGPSPRRGLDAPPVVRDAAGNAIPQKSVAPVRTPLPEGAPLTREALRSALGLAGGAR